MPNVMKQVGVLVSNYAVREETFEGRKYLVAPVVPLVEGVHNGAYYPASEIARYVEAWNGRPLPVQHPKRNGRSVSANEPRLIESMVVGNFFGAEFDPNGGKLKGELWIDIEKAQRVNPSILQILRAGQPLEVSTGLWPDEEQTEGVWNGEEYDAIYRNFRPDHIALLPNGKGACSFDDGCGVRANSFRAALRKVLSFVGLAKDDDGMSLDDRHTAVARAVQALDNGTWVHWIRELFDDRVVYEAVLTDPSVGEQGKKLYRRGYKIDEETGEATLAEEAEEVREVRKYEPVSNEEGDAMTKDGAIKALINDPHTRFEETDREWLKTLDDARLAKLSCCGDHVDPKVTGDPPKKEEPKAGDPLPKGNEGDPPKEKEPAPKGNEGDPPKEKDEKPVTAEDYINAAPPEVRSVLSRGLAIERETKDKIVRALVANKRNKFTEEQLKAKDLGELEMLAALAEAEVNYEGRSGAPRQNADDSDEIPEMPKVFENVA